MTECKRKLTKQEIASICDSIEINKYYDAEIAISIRQNVIDNIGKQLERVEIYPQAIPKLQEQIKLSYENSIAHPGEGVGCIAASSIGEVATQASLNSFHSTGLNKANLSTGVPRIKELLNASKLVKTPSCTIYLRPEVGDLKDLFVVKDFCDREIIYHDIKSIMQDLEIQYNPILTDYETNYYQFFQLFYEDICTENLWRIKILFSSASLFKIKKSLSYIAGCIKLALNLHENSLSIVFYPDIDGRIDIWINEDVESPSQIIKRKKYKGSEVATDDTEIRINESNKMYFFIKDVIVPLLYECPVSGMFGIEECYFTEDKGGDWIIDTKGSNYREIVNHPLIEYKKSKSNNVWDVYEIFGIDAAKNFLEEEFGKNITVNKRHLDLLTSSMTSNGKISSVSRYGIDRKQVGPLAKICFEQPFDNSIQAALNGEKDRLVGASANIALGKHIKSGTGMVELILQCSQNADHPLMLNSKQSKLSNYELVNDIMNSSCRKESSTSNLMGPIEEEDEMDTIY